MQTDQQNLFTLSVKVLALSVNKYRPKPFQTTWYSLGDSTSALACLTTIAWPYCSFP